MVAVDSQVREAFRLTTATELFASPLDFSGAVDEQRPDGRNTVIASHGHILRPIEILRTEKHECYNPLELYNAASS